MTYFLNDKAITEKAGKLKFIYTDAGGDFYNCEIRIASPSPDDGGAYKIAAKNSAGESTAMINLNLSGQFPVYVFSYVTN